MLTLYIADVERDVGMKKLSQEEAAKVLEDMKVKIEIPKAAVTQWKRNTALDMAIEALSCSEIPNSSDCISRQAAIDALQKEINKGIPPFDDVMGSIRCGVRLARNIIEDLPSAEPERLTDDDFETIRIHLNSYKEKLCNQQRWEEAEEYQRIIDRFMAFASAQPEPKKGEWINKEFYGIGEGSAECSICHKRSSGYKEDDGWSVHCLFYDFCPICGSDNREEKRNDDYMCSRSDSY